MRRFVDAWLRAVASVDAEGYRALGFPATPAGFARDHAGHESHRLDDLRIDTQRSDSQVFIEARLSYVFEDARGRWRTDDRHRLVLQRTPEGLRYQAHWK